MKTHWECKIKSTETEDHFYIKKKKWGERQKKLFFFRMSDFLGTFYEKNSGNKLKHNLF